MLLVCFYQGFMYIQTMVAPFFEAIAAGVCISVWNRFVMNNPNIPSSMLCNGPSAHTTAHETTVDDSPRDDCNSSQSTTIYEDVGTGGGHGFHL